MALNYLVWIGAADVFPGDLLDGVAENVTVENYGAGIRSTGACRTKSQLPAESRVVASPGYFASPAGVGGDSGFAAG